MLCDLPNMQHLSNRINYCAFCIILSFLEYCTVGVQIFCVAFLDSAKANVVCVISMTSALFSHSNTVLCSPNVFHIFIANKVLAHSGFGEI